MNPVSTENSSEEPRRTSSELYDASCLVTLVRLWTNQNVIMMITHTLDEWPWLMPIYELFNPETWFCSFWNADLLRFTWKERVHQSSRTASAISFLPPRGFNVLFSWFEVFECWTSTDGAVSFNHVRSATMEKVAIGLGNLEFRVSSLLSPSSWPNRSTNDDNQFLVEWQWLKPIYELFNPDVFIHRAIYCQKFCFPASICNVFLYIILQEANHSWIALVFYLEQKK